MSRTIVRPHLACWFVWRMGNHVATITHTPHGYVVRRATAPRIILATCSTWSAAKHFAKKGIDTRIRT